MKFTPGELAHFAFGQRNYSKGVDFIEYSIDGDEEARSQMAKRANGRRSVPQIFINDQHVGGCDDIHELDFQGKLDPLLASAKGA